MADDVKIRIKAVEAYRRAMDLAKAGIKGLGRATVAAGRTMLRATKWMIAGLTGLSIWSVKTAADVREMRNKFAVVFGELTDETRKWAAELAQRIGRSATKIEGFLANIQDLVVPMTKSREEAAKLSKEIVKLGFDVASFQNKQAPDVIMAFGKALLGERESLKTYGIAISEDEVKAEALRLGLIKNIKQYDASAKALAGLSLMQKKSKDAQGDAERTADSFNNSIRNLKDQFFDFRRDMGEQIITGLKLESLFVKLRDKTRAWFAQLKESGVVENLATRLGEISGRVFDLMDALSAGGKRRAEAVEGLKKIGSDFGEKAADALKDKGADIGIAIAKGIATAPFKFGRFAGQKGAAAIHRFATTKGTFPTGASFGAGTFGPGEIQRLLDAQNENTKAVKELKQER